MSNLETSALLYLRMTKLVFGDDCNFTDVCQDLTPTPHKVSNSTTIWIK